MLARIFAHRNVSSNDALNEGGSSADVVRVEAILGSPAKSPESALRAKEQAEPSQNRAGASRLSQQHSEKAAQRDEKSTKQTSTPVGNLSGKRKSKRQSTSRSFRRDADGEFVSLLSHSSKSKQTPQAGKSSLKGSGSKSAGLRSAARQKSGTKHCRTALDFTDLEATPAESPAKALSGQGVEIGSVQNLRSAAELHQGTESTSPHQAANDKAIDSMNEGGLLSLHNGGSNASEKMKAGLGRQGDQATELKAKPAQVKPEPVVKLEPQVWPPADHSAIIILYPKH